MRWLEKPIYDLLPLRKVVQRGEVRIGDHGVLWIDTGEESFGYEAEIVLQVAQIASLCTKVPIDPDHVTPCKEWAMVVRGEVVLGGPSFAMGERVPFDGYMTI